MMKNSFALVIALSVTLAACQTSKQQPTGDPAFLSKFKALPATDTMRFEVVFDDSIAMSGDTLPNAPFFAALDTAWIQAIENVADTAEATVLAKGRFPLTKDYDACLVEINWGWYKHKSLLVYDKQNHAFTDRVTVAQWFGGDGGQILNGSWLVDTDGDGNKDLVLRQIEHWLVMKEDGDVQENTIESASLMLWNNGRFHEMPITDTMEYVTRYPIKSAW